MKVNARAKAGGNGIAIVIKFNETFTMMELFYKTAF